MSSLRQLRQMANFASTIYRKSLQDTDTRATPPHPSFKAHQLTSLARMQTLEVQLREGVSIEGHVLRANHAFLADDQGSGKSRVAIAHILQMKSVATNMPTYLHTNSTPECFSVSEVEDRPFRLYSNLLVVPHTLFHQWESEFQYFPSLKPLFLRSIKCIESESLFEKLETVDCVIISNTLYPAFANICKQKDQTLCWRRIFFDEADTIRIPSSSKVMRTQFTWFITSSFFSFSFVNSFIHSHHVRNLTEEELALYHPHIQGLLQQHIQQSTIITYYRVVSSAFFQPYLRNTHPLRWYLVVRCDSDFVKRSIELPNVDFTTIQCEPPPISLHEGTLPNQIWQLIQAGNLKSAYAALQLRQEPTPLSDRVSEFLQEGCPICFDACSWPIQTSCCSRPFCASCYFRCLTTSIYCPMCRDIVEIQGIRYIETPSYSIETPIPQYPTKLQAILNLVHENPKGKFILYTRSEVQVYGAQEHLRTLNIRTSFLKGSKTAIASQLREFKAGTINMLLLCPYSNIQGIGIPDATHLILYNPLREHEKHHILHRLYRLGRTSPLQVYTLNSEVPQLSAAPATVPAAAPAPVPVHQN